MSSANAGRRRVGGLVERLVDRIDRLTGGRGGEELAEFRAWAEEYAESSPAPQPILKRPRERSGAVLVAFLTNVVTTVAKAIAAVVTGSAALMADTLHSLADTGTNLLLIIARRRSRRRPDLTHPYGYGGELFYWSLLSALSIFVAGGVLSIWDGVRQIYEGGEATGFVLGYAILGVGLATDVYSLAVATRELGAEAKSRGVTRRVHLKTTTDTTTSTVFLQEVAAVIGGGLAIVGLAGHQLTGSAWPDGLAAVAIGVLLAGVGVRLVRRNRELLTLRADSPVVQDRVKETLLAEDGVEDVGRVHILYVGPHQLLVLVEFQPESSASVTHLVETIRARVDEALPKAVDVFVMPIEEVAHRRLTRLDQEYWQRRFPEPEQD